MSTLQFTEIKLKDFDVVNTPITVVMDVNGNGTFIIDAASLGKRKIKTDDEWTTVTKYASFTAFFVEDGYLQEGFDHFADITVTEFNDLFKTDGFQQQLNNAYGSVKIITKMSRIFHDAADLLERLCDEDYEP